MLKRFPSLAACPTQAICVLHGVSFRGYREFLLNLSYIVAVVFGFNPLCVIEDKPQNDSSFLDVFAGVRFHQPCFKNSDSMPVEDAVDVARVKVQYIYFYKFEYLNQVLQIKTSWGDKN